MLSYITEGRGVRAVYGDGLENRSRLMVSVGSNPTPSAGSQVPLQVQLPISMARSGRLPYLSIDTLTSRGIPSGLRL